MDNFVALEPCAATVGLTMSESTGPPPKKDARVRSRMIVDVDDEIREAVELRKLKTGAESKSDVVGHLLREALAEEIEEVRRFRRLRDRAAPRKKGGAQ